MERRSIRVLASLLILFIGIIQKVNRKETVKAFIESEIDRLKAENRINNASSHKHFLL